MTSAVKRLGKVVKIAVDITFAFLVIDLVAKGGWLGIAYVLEMRESSVSKIDFNEAISTFFVFRLYHWILVGIIAVFYGLRKVLRRKIALVLIMKYLAMIVFIYLVIAGITVNEINKGIIENHPYQYTVGAFVYLLSVLISVIILCGWDCFWQGCKCSERTVSKST
ncbi:MAG: hypothetical protein GXO48_02300 [Chlorobi bacterium]|nr:hypothetical protein [Chlorobiota bacterium]